MATVKEFVRKSSSELHGPAHPCDAPGLSPKEFLLAIMHDLSLSIQTRIKAAADLLPLTEPVPRPVVQGPTITIVIGGIKDPDEINTISQSKSAIANNSHHPQSETPGPINTETPSPPQTFKPFLFTPGPSYIEHTEILQVKAAVNKLRPDLAHLPLPDQFYHCSRWDCWFTFPCDCPRDASKLN